MFRLAGYFPVLIAALAGASGCHNPPIPQHKPVTYNHLEAKWQNELVPGRKADRALAYLLDQGFECQMTRDENANILGIVAYFPETIRDTNGFKRNWRIEIAISENLIKTTEIKPLIDQSQFP